jgi:nitrogen regulatory protein P-II 1
MKLITALLRSEQFPAVKKALFEAEFRHLTASSIMGTAPLTEQRMYRGEAREITLFRRVKVEVYVDDEQVESAVASITKGARIHGGWGRIFVTDVLSSIIVWEGEESEKAS